MLLCRSLCCALVRCLVVVPFVDQSMNVIRISCLSMLSCVVCLSRLSSCLCCMYSHVLGLRKDLCGTLGSGGKVSLKICCICRVIRSSCVLTSV